MRRVEMSDLQKTANDATRAGMTYGRYMQEQYAAEHRANREKLRDMQPVYIKDTGEYLCPQCAHELEKYKNCGSCGKVIIWKKGEGNA